MSTEKISKDDFSLFSNKLRELREKNDLSQAEVASKVGVHVQTWSKYERGEVEPSLKTLSKLADTMSVNLNWLLTGIGPMRHGESAQPLASGEYVTVPYRRQSASAGHGALVEAHPDEPRRMAFRRDWIDTHLHTTRGGLFLMAARGASMEPKIENGDMLLIDSTQTKIRTGDIYVWTYGEGENHEVIVKKAARRTENGEEIIELVSENEGFRSEDRIVRDKNRHLYKCEGRVVWIGRTLE